MGRIFKISLNDFLTKKFILLSLLPFLISLIVFGYFMFFGGNELFEMLTQGAKTGDFSFLDEEKYPLITKILKFSASKWIISVIFYVAGAFVTLILSVFTALLIAGFLTPIVTKEINQRHYKIEKKDEISSLKVMKLMSVEILKFLFIFILCAIFLFIPIINLFIINVPLFYIYYKFLLIDVGSNALDKYSFEKVYKKGGGYKFSFSTFLFYLASLIPFVGVFFQLFFVIFLTHILYENEQRKKW